MASGLPILHAGPGHGREIVQEAGAGITVDNNPNAIADGIRQLTASQEQIDEWGVNARAWVDPRWSWKRLVPEWLTGVRERMQ
jgi:glycosyltransferase involved in cell wall biosynthesis